MDRNKTLERAKEIYGGFTKELAIIYALEEEIKRLEGEVTSWKSEWESRGEDIESILTENKTLTEKLENSKIQVKDIYLVGKRDNTIGKGQLWGINYKGHEIFGRFRGSVLLSGDRIIKFIDDSKMLLHDYQWQYFKNSIHFVE